MEKSRKISAAFLIALCITFIIPSVAPYPTLTTVNAAEDIVINKSSITLKAGETFKLKLRNTNKTPKWETSDKKIAAVNNKGKVTAKKSGNATIKATLGKKTYKCTVSVEAQSGSSMVWISETGEKYHRIANCGTMNPDKATKISRDDAISQGYEPCSKCF